ncbi:MAG: hypothetical protein JO076_11170 [Verrucomicrobia bacterium]|nr:hypothetical protein [Verrucomicrobiota bacterium]
MKGYHLDPKSLRVALVIAPLIIATIVFFVARQVYYEELKARSRLNDSYFLLQQLTDLRNEIDRLEDSESSFLITGDYSSLVPYTFARIAVPLRLLVLKQLVAHQDLASAKIDKLEALLREQDLKMTGAITYSGAMRTSTRFDELLPLQKIRSAILDLQNQGDQLLAKHLLASDKQLNISELVSLSLLAVVGAVVVGAGILLLRIRQLQSIITICAWTQRVNFNGKWMRMEEFLWERFRVKVSHGISEEAFEGVMGIVGKKLTVSDNRPEKPPNPKGRQEGTAET